MNDGSRDGTAALIDELAASRSDVVAVHHATNLGMPAGWRSERRNVGTGAWQVLA